MCKLSAGPYTTAFAINEVCAGGGRIGIHPPLKQSIHFKPRVARAFHGSSTTRQHTWKSCKTRDSRQVEVQTDKHHILELGKAAVFAVRHAVDDEGAFGLSTHLSR